MSEEVATPLEAESPETATPPEEDVTTWKKRLAGKDQALTRVSQEREQLAQEVEALRLFKAQQEQANMTELERAMNEAREAKAEAERARAEAAREKLARKFPLAVEFYGDDPLPSEDRLAALNEKLAVKATEEEEPAPRIDPNRARRTAPLDTRSEYEQLRDAFLEQSRAEWQNLTNPNQ